MADLNPLNYLIEKLESGVHALRVKQTVGTGKYTLWASDFGDTIEPDNSKEYSITPDNKEFWDITHINLDIETDENISEGGISCTFHVGGSSSSDRFARLIADSGNQIEMRATQIFADRGEITRPDKYAPNDVIGLQKFVNRHFYCHENCPIVIEISNDTVETIINSIEIRLFYKIH